MIREKLCTKNWIICVLIKHFLTKKAKPHTIQSSLNSNKTLSFISHVVVLNFSNSSINRWYQLLVCGHNGPSNVSWISEEADFIERIYPVGSSEIYQYP